jgi:putative hydrolase of the HAD superfamily
MMRRAIVFDLDETLYRERRFALSGYRAVAVSVERDFGISRSAVFRSLALSLRRGRRGVAFQDLAQRFGLPDRYVPRWLEVYRHHEPVIRLSPRVRRALEGLRTHWRTGVLTNGLPRVQASKIEALGVGRLVDAVVYADDFDGGKPSTSAFLAVTSRLGVDPASTVFAGDDPSRDIAGARRAGMKTILVDRHRGGDAAEAMADAIVRRLEDVPAVAERLLEEEPHEH